MSQQAVITPIPTIVPAGEGPVWDAFGDRNQVKLGAEQTGGALTLLLITTMPGGGPPPHLHRDEDELFIIVQGQYRFLVQGAWREAGPGDVVYAPKSSVHTFQNIGDTPAQQWVLTRPSGFEFFFERCAQIFAEASAGPPDMERILTISDEHGIEFVPPLPRATNGAA